MGEYVSRLDPVDGDDMGTAVFIDCDVLPGPAEDFKDPFVGLLKGPLDVVNPDEDVGAVFEVLADERLCGIGARLHGLQACHGLLEAAGEILDAARWSVLG